MSLNENGENGNIKEKRETYGKKILVRGGKFEKKKIPWNRFPKKIIKDAKLMIFIFSTCIYGYFIKNISKASSKNRN